MSIFSDESNLLIANWEAVTDILSAKDRLTNELSRFLYSVENNLLELGWWSNGWVFKKESKTQAYISKQYWKTENDYALWIGVESFNPEAFFGTGSSPRMFVWVSNKRTDLIKMLTEKILQVEGEIIGEIDSRASTQYIVIHEVMQFLPEEMDDFESVVRNQILDFFEYYALLLEQYSEEIKALL